MHHNFINAQDILIQCGIRISQVLGLSEGMAKIAVFLYASPHPVSMQEICRRLDLTKGTVSLYLRLLEERKVVIQSWIKNSGRQKYYEINPNLWEDVAKDMRERAIQRTHITETAVKESLELLRQDKQDYNPEETVALKLLEERLEKIRHINRFTHKILNNIHSILPEDLSAFEFPPCKEEKIISIPIRLDEEQ